MSIFSVFMNSISKNKVSDWIPDIEFDDPVAQRVYLKEMAKSTVINFVARTMSTTEIRFKNKKESQDWEYILNVRPNKDTSASDFWQKFFYRLIDENEVLVIFTDDNQLLIADDFNHNKYAIYEDTFDSVVVKEYVFKRTFRMSDVIYLEYNNEKLDRFTKGLFDDYGELFGRIIEIAMRNNQIRASVGIDSTGTYKDDVDEKGRSMSDRLQGFVNKIYKSFRTNSVAIVPKLKGFTYEEYTDKRAGSNQSLDDLEKMKQSLINDLANIIGVPTALIYGEKLDLDSSTKAFKKLCTDLLKKKLQDELNAKILEPVEYQNGQRVQVIGVLKRDPFELAVQIDKVISCGFFTPNQALEEFEYEPSTNPIMDRHYITKNYELTRGGESNDSEDSD